MAYRRASWKPFKPLFVEDIGNQAHRLFEVKGLAVGGADAGPFLAPVLQGVKAQIGEVGCFGMAEDAEDAAFFMNVVE